MAIAGIDNSERLDLGVWEDLVNSRVPTFFWGRGITALELRDVVDELLSDSYNEEITNKTHYLVDELFTE